jgi:hypothetical protein
MIKTKRSLPGLLLAGGLLFACCSKPNDVSPDPGSSDAAAGTTNDAAIYPDDAGHCPMQGAYPRAGGVCVCQANVPNVCGATCTDTQSDVDHCGDCATKCPAMSVCNKGKCSVPPVVVVPAPGSGASADGGAASCGPLHLAIAGTTLYVADEAAGTVSRLPTAGGAPMLVASGQKAPTSLQIVGGSLFWLARDDKTILRAALAGGAPSVVATAATTDAKIGGFAVTPDGLTVYYSTSKTDPAAMPLGAINKVAASGGAITVVGSEDHGIPTGLSVDGPRVAYTVDLTGDVNAIDLVAGTLAQCGLPPVADMGDETGVDCDRLGRSQGALLLDAIFAFGGSAYWIDRENLRTAVIAPNATYNSVGSAVGNNAFTAITLDGTTTAYLTEEGSRNCITMNDAHDCVAYGPASPAFVEKVPLIKGSTSVPLGRFFDPSDPTKATSATSVAIDATNVYFATIDCAILRAAK